MNETTIRNIEEDFKNYKVLEKCYQGLLEWKESVGHQRAIIKNLCYTMRRVGA